MLCIHSRSHICDLLLRLTDLRSEVVVWNEGRRMQSNISVFNKDIIYTKKKKSKTKRKSDVLRLVDLTTPDLCIILRLCH